ncbi:MAG: hypothetical protein MAG794_01137 [Gammaproteobacteria bacterium]|nr:hypothetical protein [Gammaproteobacteria bacterium]
MSEKSIIRVRDVMSANYRVVDGLITVTEGLQIMESSDVRALVVDKRDPDDVFGLVLMSDIAKNVLAEDRSCDRVSLYEIMAKPVVWVESGMDIRYCARLFHNFGLAIAPVLEKGAIIGVVSYHEMVLNGLAKLKK